MHEISIAQALLEQVQSVAQEQGAVRALLVTVRVGPLSGVEPALLQRAFEVARLTRVATATAGLVVEHSQIHVTCLDCHRESGASVNHLLCRVCGSQRTRLSQGDELLLLQVELEMPDVATAIEQLTGSSGENLCNA